VETGELQRGRELCERLLSFASSLQLYAEEIEPRSGRHLGNFPQAFTHLALINAVMHLIAEDAAAVGMSSLSPRIVERPSGGTRAAMEEAAPGETWRDGVERDPDA